MALARPCVVEVSHARRDRGTPNPETLTYTEYMQLPAESQIGIVITRRTGDTASYTLAVGSRPKPTTSTASQTMWFRHTAWNQGACTPRIFSCTTYLVE